MSDLQSPAYAGFVTRATAFILDDLIIVTVGTLGVIGAGLILDAVIPGGVSVNLESVLGAAAWGAVLSTAYFVGFWSLAGQTPGMRLMGIVVVPVSGGRVTFGRAVRRIVGLVACWLTLGLGFALVLVDDRRQGLNDKIAKTFVLYERED
jgi:uncharacterized RDD family membrane protein YckC